MRRQRIPKFLFAISLFLLTVGIDGLDDNIAIESSLPEVVIDLRSDGFDWSFMSGQREIEADLRLIDSEWNSGTDEEEDAQEKLDDADWDFSMQSSDEDDEVEERLDAMEGRFLFDQTTTVEEEAERRMEDFNWNWYTGSVEQNHSEGKIEESLEERDVDYRENHATKWHDKLKQIKQQQYGPAKVKPRPQSRYGPPKSPSGLTERPLKFRKSSKSQYGAFEAHKKVPKRYDDPPKSNDDSAPVSYSSQLTHSIPAGRSQLAFLGDSVQPAADNYSTTEESIPSIDIPTSSPLQSPPITADTSADPVQNYHSTPRAPVSYDFPALPPSVSDFVDSSLQTAKPPQEWQLSNQQADSKNDNLGFFQNVRFPKFEEIFQQIFKL